MTALPNVSDRSYEIAEALLRAVGAAPGQGLVTIPWSVRQLGGTLGLSAGTVQHHLSRLADCGVKVSSRPIVLDSDALQARGRPRLRLVIGDQSEAAPTATASQELLDHPSVQQPVAEQALASLERIARLAVEGTADPTHVLESVVQTIGLIATSPGGRATREAMRETAAQEAAQGASRVSSSSLVEVIRKEETPSLTEVDAARDARTRAAPVRRIGPNQRSRAELGRLLAEVLSVCEERGLPGIENASGASEAFSTFGDDQLAFAGRALARRLRREPCSIERPVGWLISRALEEAGPDPEFFVVDPPASVDRTLVLSELGIDLDLPISAWPGLIRGAAEECDLAAPPVVGGSDHEVAEDCGIGVDAVKRLRAIDDPRATVALHAVRVSCIGDPSITVSSADGPKYDPSAALRSARNALKRPIESTDGSPQ